MSATEPLRPPQLTPALAASPAASITWRDLRFSVPGPKEVLKGIAGELKPGELSCILGPSGAGKSTLLNVLAGRQRTSKNGFEMKGCIELNGQAVRPEQMKKRVAYVMQDDVLFATETVRESLLFSAALKLPGALADERATAVETVLTNLGLGNCADTMVGNELMRGISGGERKRASVGVELVADSRYVLLDEPTSGLDSFAARQLVEMLKALARNGRIVCCTIHQPASDVFELFDRVMCLRSGGTTLYQGSNSGLHPFLDALGCPCPKGYSVADWLLTQAQEQQASPATEPRAVQSTLAAGSEVLPDEIARAAFCMQLMQLTRREIRKVYRDKTTIGAQLGMSIGQAVLYAILFPGIVKSADELADMAREAGPAAAQRVLFEAINAEFGAIVSVSLAAFFGNAQPLTLTFPLERPVFLREYSSNMYSVAAYFFSKTVVEMFVTAASCFMLLIITYFAFGFHANFFMLWIYLWALGISAGSMALWLGCLVTSTKTAVQLMTVVAIPQIIFSGLLLKVDQIKPFLRWIQYLCSLKYAVNLLCIEVFGDLVVSVRVGPTETVTYDVGATFLDGQDIKKDLWWAYLAALIAIFAGFRLAAMLALRRKGQYVF